MTLKVAICPHDTTKNKVVWFEFITYISRKTDLKFSVENCLDFDCYYKTFPYIDFIYANPLDALKIHKERNFIPVAGNDNYDEVVIIANEKEKPDLEAISGNTVLCVKNQFASFLGVHILQKKGIDFYLDYRNSWQSVLNDVAKGEAPYGFVYKDFWVHLSELSKKGVILIHESNEKVSSHILMVSPEHKENRDKILNVLEEMPNDQEGNEILKKLNINKWYPVNSLEYLEKFIQEVKV